MDVEKAIKIKFHIYSCLEVLSWGSGWFQWTIQSMTSVETLCGMIYRSWLFDSGLWLYLTVVRHEIIVQCVRSWWGEVSEVRLNHQCKNERTSVLLFLEMLLMLWECIFPVRCSENSFQYVFHYRLLIILLIENLQHTNKYFYDNFLFKVWRGKCFSPTGKMLSLNVCLKLWFFYSMPLDEQYESTLIKISVILLSY